MVNVKNVGAVNVLNKELSELNVAHGHYHQHGLKRSHEWRNKKYYVPLDTQTLLEIVFSIIGLIAIGMAAKMTIRD